MFRIVRTVRSNCQGLKSNLHKDMCSSSSLEQTESAEKLETRQSEFVEQRKLYPRMFAKAT